MRQTFEQIKADADISLYNKKKKNSLQAVKFCLICTFFIDLRLIPEHIEKKKKKKTGNGARSPCRVAKNVPSRLRLFCLRVVPIMKAIFGAPRLPAARQSWPLASVACGVSDGGCANLAPQGSDRGDGAGPTSAGLPLQPRPKMLNQKRHSPHSLPA